MDCIRRNLMTINIYQDKIEAQIEMTMSMDYTGTSN